MKYKMFIIALVFVGLKINAQGGGKTVLLRNASIIDVISGEVHRGDIYVSNGEIKKITNTMTNNDFTYDESIDLSGKYVMPGLIDAHVHITHGTYDKALKGLETALISGVTSVRDMGGDGRILTLLKRNMLVGENLGSDVYFSTVLAGENFFKHDRRPAYVAKGGKVGQESWQRAITKNSNIQQIVAEAKGLGVTGVKIYQSVDKNMIKKIAKEAKKQGIKVWSHGIVQPTKAIDVTNAGSEVMSHAGDLVEYEFVKGELKNWYDFTSKREKAAYRKKVAAIKWKKEDCKVQELFKAMKKNNSILDATLHVYEFNPQRAYNKERRKRDSIKFQTALRTTKIAHEFGIKIAAGSDDMLRRKSNGNMVANLHNELQLLVKAGLSELDALRAATIINAEVLGELESLGSVDEGKIANLLILNKNPLDSISNTTDIHMVVKRGRVIQIVEENSEK